MSDRYKLADSSAVTPMLDAGRVRYLIVSRSNYREERGEVLAICDNWNHAHELSLASRTSHALQLVALLAKRGLGHEFERADPKPAALDQEEALQRILDLAEDAKEVYSGEDDGGRTY